MDPFDGTPAPGIRPQPAERARLITHAGKPIVLQDFSGVSDTGEALRAIAAAGAFMERQPKGSVLVLTDVTGSRFDEKIVDAMKQLAQHHKPWVRHSALVGLTPIMRIVYRVVVSFTRRHIHVATSRDEALDWLVRQP
jgi:hypothetical protein